MLSRRPLTLPIGALTLACIVSVNTAGYPKRMFSPYHDWNEFGWPFTFLRTNWTPAQTHTSSAWGHDDSTLPPRPSELPLTSLARTNFSITAMGLNAGVAFLVAVTFVFYAEITQRILFKDAALNIRHLLVAFVVFAIVLVASRSNLVYYVYLCNYSTFMAARYALLVGAVLGFGATIACVLRRHVDGRLTAQGTHGK